MKMDLEHIRMLKKYEKGLNILWYLSLLMGVFAIIAILGFTVMKLTNHTVLFNFTIKKMGFALKLPYDIFTTTSSILTLATVYLYLLWLIFVLYKLKSILANTYYNCTPFTNENIKYLRHISYSMFAYACLTFIIQYLNLFFINHDSEALKKINQIKDVELHSYASVPSWAIYLGLFILILAEIFRHGLNLQQDSESIV